MHTSTSTEITSVQKKEESSRPNDKLIYEKEVGSSYQGEKALNTDSIREEEIHHELDYLNINVTIVSDPKQAIQDNQKAEVTRSAQR